MSKIKFVALGGLDQKAKNCYVLEIDNDIFVFNTGIEEKLNESLGINKIIPDYSYLVENKNRIKAIFFGTPSSNNIGSLTTLLEKIGFDIPIVTTEIGKTLLLNNLFKCNRNRNYNELINFVITNPMRDMNIANHIVVSFRIYNSLPGSVGYVIKTNDGCIVYMDNYVICHDKSKAFFSQIHNIRSIIKDSNVLLMITQTGLVHKSNTFTSPFHNNKSFYDKIISDTSSRIIVGLYNNDYYSLFNIAQAAKKYQRPFIIYSKEAINVFQASIKSGIFNNKHLLSLTINDVETSKNPIIVISEDPKRLVGKIDKILEGEDDILSFREDDLFILGTQIIPGFEANISALLDDISMADIKYITLPKTILPLEPSDEDHKFAISLIQPKYVIPVGGLYMSMIEYANVINQTWMKRDQALILSNGEIVSFTNGELDEVINKLELDLVPLNSSGTNDLVSSVIYERQQMLSSGMVSISMLINKQGRIVSDIQINQRGFINNDEISTKQKFDEIIDNFKNNVYSLFVFDNNKVFDYKESANNVKKTFAKACSKAFDKRPLILSSIVEVK